MDKRIEAQIEDMEWYSKNVYQKDEKMQEWLKRNPVTPLKDLEENKIYYIDDL